MTLVLWVIAGLLLIVCIFLSMAVKQLALIARLTITASDMNEENQTKIISGVRRIHMVEKVLKDVRRSLNGDAEDNIRYFDQDHAADMEIADLYRKE